MRVAHLSLYALFLTGTLSGEAVFAQTCRLALSLAMDVSASVDETEYAQQRDGLAAALEHEDVISAIFGVPDATIALHAYEWSGRRNQAEVLGWTIIRNPSHLSQLAAQLRKTTRSQTEFPTSLGSALGYGAVSLGKSPPCNRKTLDVSGDGRNNDGFAPEHAYNSFDFSQITVNGLAIGGADGEILPYYLKEVIHGPGAFAEFAIDYSDYARAIRQKLIREIGAQHLASFTDIPPSNGLP